MWRGWWNGTSGQYRPVPVAAHSSLPVRVVASCFHRTSTNILPRLMKLGAILVLRCYQLTVQQLFLHLNTSGVAILGIASEIAGPGLQSCLLVWYRKAALVSQRLSYHHACFFEGNKFHTGSDQSQTVLLCLYMQATLWISSQWLSSRCTSMTKW